MNFSQSEITDNFVRCQFYSFIGMLPSEIQTAPSWAGPVVDRGHLGVYISDIGTIRYKLPSSLQLFEGRRQPPFVAQMDRADPVAKCTFLPRRECRHLSQVVKHLQCFH